MIRALFVVAALAVSAPALACGGDQPCAKEHCKMKPQTEVDAAKAAVEAADGTKVAFSVSGMSCGNCSDAVTKMLQKIEGVHAVAVSHAEGQALLAIDESKTNLDALIAVINDSGTKFKAEKAES